MAGAQETDDGIEDLYMDGTKREAGFDSQPEPNYHQDPRDVEMTDSPMMSTPAHAGILPLSMFNSRPYTGPVTRSMTKARLGHLVGTLPHATSLGDRLKSSSKRHVRNSNVSKLEESRDISYIMNDRITNSDEITDNTRNMTGQVRDQALFLDPPPLDTASTSHPLTGQLRISSRGSSRVDNGNAMIAEATVLSDKSRAKEPKSKSRRRLKASNASASRYVRRSPRFMKPLTEFPKYRNLPDELKIMIWEAAIEPRLVYIVNRYSLSHTQRQFEVQNDQPSWFNACRLSRWVARLHYLNLFAMYSPVTNSFNPRTLQAVTGDDIVIFEPCHGGCRGCYCAKNQYNLRDRSMVRSLAIQAESPNLPPTTEPCWKTIARSWHNVETLYLMRTAVKGVDKRNKAMIRVMKNAHETALLKRFDEWKKGPGINAKIKRIEFVVVVKKEVARSNNPRDRYKFVEDRLTDQPEDIILG
ncbi:uncharacterized protein F4812DRAFT_78988 [Daldinia caldariorum]|uniref:uncharacterized protein n=1 Tax=Daldinia caldariorum TaxID=326644 RepID=UPI002007F881|nr:uncharacterized protein F4812DRAFT_78988 [Daldinia caldariorum]KAI1466440.1 hypothetical protein F4812DRAFT_78988 [Daldinia caldariorum]